MSNHQIYGYKEVCEGFSSGEFQGKPVIFAHQSLFDQCSIEEERIKTLNWAASRGYDSKEVALKKAIERGDWTEEEESSFYLKMQDYRDVWSRRGKIDPIGMVQNIRGFHSLLREMKNEIDVDAVKRSMITPECQESFANARAYDYEMFLMTRKLDRSPLFTEDEFNNLGDAELGMLRVQYSKAILKFTDDYFEKMAVASFFYSIFDNYAANPGDFFMKPAPELTVFQMDILRCAKRYNEVIKIAWDAPSDFYDDPKMLETFAIVKNNGGGSGGEVGADEVRQDIEKVKGKRN